VESVETLVIGAGQAGLAMSQQLARRNLPHLILERGRIGERWWSERWEGMHFQTPNHLVRFPDFPLPAENPNDFARAGEIGDYLNSFAAHIRAPVRCGVAVRRLRPVTDGWIAETESETIMTKNVVVATGPFQVPKIPCLLQTSPGILQIHAAAYRAPQQLPPGAVLVIGAGASGAQIADELLRAGRKVYLSVSRHRRAPPRYPGRDPVWWWIETGMDKTPVENKPSNAAPLVHSGAYGGKTIDFRDYARQGMVLLGHAESAEGNVMRFAPDLLDSLAHGDDAYRRFMDFVDAHIAAKCMDLPEDPAARAVSPTPTWLHEPIRELDLTRSGVATVIWCTGYGVDFSWIDAPIFVPNGTPAHRGGITALPGLYFLGLPWQSQFSSSFLFGVSDDATRLANHIAGKPL
jgi:putative flavoprotein involved in K+ transport